MNSKRYDGVDHPVREVTDLRDIINSSCQMFPEVDAYLYKDKSKGEFVGIKYSQVKADMDALGTRFCDMGLRNKKIAVIGETSYYWFLTYYAVVCGTGVIVPLDKNLPPEEVKTLVHRSKANAIVYSKKMEKSVKGLFDDPGQLEYFISMEEDRHKGLAADGDPDNDRGESGASGNRILSLKQLIYEGADLVHQGERGFIDAEIDPGQMATLIFTSGTTGKAKGVMLSHKNIASNVVNMSRRERLGENFVILSILPTHHTFENTCVDWTTFYQGKTLAICEGIKYISKNMNEVHANCMVGVPLVFEKIYKGMMKQADSTGQGEKLRNAIQLSRRLKLYNNPRIVKRMFKSIHEALGGEMQQFIAGGAAIDPQVILDFEAMGIPMMQGYGMTECSPIIAVNQNNYSIAESVGRPMHGTTVRIDNPDTDGVGEIVCKGPSVMLGYYEDPDATEEVLRDGWLYTGDLGYMDENGFLYVTGRKKTVIVTKGGKNIFPEEIEEVLKQNDVIKEVLVHGVTDKRIGNVAVTADIQPNFQVLKERYGDMDQSEIYHFFRDLVDKVNDTMPAYKAIKRVNIREKDFEMTTTGKIKRYGNFVEGEEGGGSLSYMEIKNEEAKRAADLVKEISQSEKEAYLTKELVPITDIRDMLRKSAEAAPAGDGENSYKQLLADVNGLGTAMINRGMRGKEIQIPCDHGSKGLPQDYNSLVLLLAAACGAGKAVLSEEPPAAACGAGMDSASGNVDIGARNPGAIGTLGASVEALIEEGKNQLAQGDRQFIDAEVLGTDIAIEINGNRFTHAALAEALMATAAMLSEDMNPSYVNVKATSDSGESGESRDSGDSVNTGDSSASGGSGNLGDSGNPGASGDSKVDASGGRAPLMAEILMERLLPIYRRKSLGLVNSGAEEALTEDTETRTEKKNRVLVYIVPECAAPIAVMPAAEGGISFPSLFSRKTRKMKRILADGACGQIIPGLGIRFADIDLSGNGEICLAGGTLMENTEAENALHQDASPAKWRDGWLHTGDLGHLDEDGYLYITGKVTDRFVGDKKDRNEV